MQDCIESVIKRVDGDPVAVQDFTERVLGRVDGNPVTVREMIARLQQHNPDFTFRVGRGGTLSVIDETKDTLSVDRSKCLGREKID